MRQTMSSIHGSPIQRGGVIKKSAPIAIAIAIIGHFKALNTHPRLDLSDRQHRLGGHARCRTGNRSRPTKLQDLRPRSETSPAQLYVPHPPSPASSSRVGTVVAGDTAPYPPREALVCTYSFQSQAGPPSAAPPPASDRRSDNVYAETPVMAESGGRW